MADLRISELTSANLPLSGAEEVPLVQGGVTKKATVNDYLSNFTSALDLKADLVGGKIPQSQIPQIAITNTFVVASEIEMLGLTAETGDVAIRTDINKTFILTTDDPTILANWQEFLTPTDSVTSVNGQQGVVVLDSDDVTEGGSNLYFTNLRVLSTPLTGLSTATSQVITATDTILQAFGYLQGQLNNRWGLQGNAGTNPATDFIGTTDANNFRIGVNNSKFFLFNTTGQLILPYNDGTTPTYPLNINRDDGSVGMRIGIDSDRTATFVNTTGSSAMRFRVLVSGVATDLIYLRGNGFTGINCNSGNVPTKTLDINGELRIRTLPTGLSTENILVVNGTGDVRSIASSTFYLASNPNGYTSNTGTVTSVALASGTSGTDVNISGSPITGSGTITINIPTANGTNRGLLTSADWTNFTGKFTGTNANLSDITTGTDATKIITAQSLPNVLFCTSSLTKLGVQTSATGTNSMAIGYQSNMFANSGISIGDFTLNSGIDSVVIGVSAQNSQAGGIAIGDGSTNTGVNGLAIGYQANSAFANAVVLGQNATADETGQLSFSRNGSIQARFSTSLMTATRKWNLPNANGTFALTSDLSNFISQNGNSFGAKLTIGTNDAQAFAIETSGSERVTVLSNGNVGIGTTAPGTPLEVVTGASFIRMTTNDGNGSNGGFGLSFNISNYPHEFARIAGNYETSALGGSGGLRFDTRNAGTLSTKMTILGNGNVGIGTTLPNDSAQLQVESTTKGFLPPRMTTAQKNAITSPPAGLVVYDTTLNKLCVMTASAWETITST